MQPNYQPPAYPPGYGQYAQPVPQQAPPGYGYPVQPGYGQPAAPMAPQFQPPQYAQPAPAQSAPQPGAGLPDGEFTDPSRGGELSPKIRHMVNRTVIIEPLRIDETAKGMPQPGKEAEVRPCLYAHVTIVPGGIDKSGAPLGLIEFGDEIKGGRQTRPNTHAVQAPYRVTNLMINNTWIVQACRDALPPFGNGLMLGVVERGTQGNEPFLLTKVAEHVDGSERPDAAQRLAAAKALWAQIKAGQFANPTPTQLQPVAGSAYAQPAPAYQPQPAQYGGPIQPGMVPTPYGPAPTSTVHPAYAAAVAPPGAQQYGQPVQSAPPAAAPSSAPVGLPPGFDVTQCPPGWDAGAWSGFAANPQQAAAIWANIFAQQQPATAPGAPAGVPPIPANMPGQPPPW